MSQSDPDSPPPSIPDHELLKRIGGGSYGEVWLARTALGAWRAVKIIDRKSFEDDRPFEREFSGIQKFEPISRSHDGLVDILQVGRQKDSFYYVMELADDANAPVAAEVTRLNSKSEVQNPKLLIDQSLLTSAATYQPKTLRAVLKERGRLPANECVEIGLALTSGLAHMHKHGLVHRDIKPSNIIFVGGAPKLADIGLVTDADTTLSYVGTEGYIPPEGPGAAQADIFSLGKVLYEMATGQDRRQFPDLPPDLKDWPDQAAVLEFNEVLVQACARDARLRYQSCEEMHADLALLQHGKSVRRQRTMQQLWATSKKAGVALLMVALVVVMVQRQAARSDPAGLGPDSTNLVANMLCAKGLLIVQEDNYEKYAEAYTNFYQAIARDTNFARPYVGLLDLRMRHMVPSLGPTSLEEMHRIAARLKELAPHSAAAALAESTIRFEAWDFPAARRSAEQAIKTSPGYELGHIWYGWMLVNWGLTSEARAEADISRTLAPSKATSYRLRGHTYRVERNFTNAITWYRQAISLDRHELAAHLSIGEAFRAMGAYTNALDYFETTDLLRNPGNESETRQSFDQLRQAFKEGGARGYWQEEWKRTETEPNEDFYWKAAVQIRLGDTNAALNWLEKSFETHERSGYQSAMESLLFDEFWDGLHDHPRFKELLDKVGFTKVMASRKK